jgi:hypothetical protein
MERPSSTSPELTCLVLVGGLSPQALTAQMFWSLLVEVPVVIHMTGQELVVVVPEDG